MTKVGLGHGMVRSLQNQASPLIVLQWLKLQWLFLKTILNRKTANTNVKKQSLYTSDIDSHIENSKNQNCEFSCRARLRCDDVLYN